MSSVLKPKIAPGYSVYDLQKDVRSLKDDLVSKGFSEAAVSTKLLDVTFSLSAILVSEQERQAKTQSVLSIEQLKLAQEDVRGLKSDLNLAQNDLRESRYQLDTFKVRRDSEYQVLMTKYETL